MYKTHSPGIKPTLLSTPHYKITVAAATNPPPILSSPSRHESLLPNSNPLPIFPFSALAPARLLLTMRSWLRMRRSRCFFLLLCSPLLIPFICATFPILCVAEVCFRICPRRRSGKAAAQVDEENPTRRCEEGCCSEGEEREVGLLQRYLEDQLALVGSVYDCSDVLDEHQNVDPDLDLDSRGPLLI